MKRFATAFGLCALLLASGAAYGAAFVWDGNAGGGDASWLTANNWTANSSYPGELTANNTDTATISDDTTESTVFVDGMVTYDVTWVVVNAETAGGDMTLKIDTDGDLDVLNSGSGYIWLVAGSHSLGGMPPTYASDDANLWVAAGTLNVDDLNIDGGLKDTSRGDRGTAYLDFDVDPTINDDVTVTGDANFAIDDPTTVGDDMIIGDGSDYGDVIQSGASSLTVTDDMTIQSGDAAGEDSIYELTAGTLDVNGTVTVQGAASVDAEAEIQITAGTFTPTSMVFSGRTTADNGHAIGDFDAGVTVQGSCDGTVDTCMEGHVDIELANSSTVDAKDLKIGDCGSSGNSGTVAVSGNGTLRACSFVMKGGSSVNSTLTVSDNASVETYDPS
jgi:hypothetical protein